MNIKNFIKKLTRKNPKFWMLIRSIPLISKRGIFHVLGTSYPDTFYPFRDIRTFKEISHLTIESIGSPYQDLSRTIGKALGYVYGAGVVGDIVEFGTQTGKSAIAITAGASYLNKIFREGDPRGVKNLFFFDSFVGLPQISSKVDKKSPHYIQRTWDEGGCSYGYSANGLKKILNKYKKSPIKINVIKGWFKDSVPLLGDDIKFSLIHVDGDLYESAIDCLEPLFSRKKISEGAIILFDDWNCNRASPEFGERKAFDELCQKYKIKYSHWTDYAHYSKGFIIHSYI